MNDHIGDTNKMVSDTPRMKAAQMAAMEHGTGDVWRVGCDIERELNAANQHIKRLEDVVNNPAALWANWLRGTVKLPAGIGDVRQYQERIHQLEDRIKRASTAFFADGSDRQAASGMLKILEEERSKQ